MKKRIFSLLLVAVLVLGCFAGCVSIEEEELEEETESVAAETETVNEEDDENTSEAIDITGIWYERDEGVSTFTFDGKGSFVFDMYGNVTEGSYTFDGEIFTITESDIFTDVNGYIDEEFNLILVLGDGDDEWVFVHESMMRPNYESEEEVYDYFASEQCTELCYDASSYEQRIEEITAEYITESTPFNVAMEGSTEPSDELGAVIAEANEYIIDYFEIYYDVSVEDEIAALKVYVYEFDYDGPNGVYYLPDEDGSDGKTIFLDKDTVADFDEGLDGFTEEDWKTFVYEIYVHETMHYLGSCCALYDNIDWMYVFEGMTCAWTEYICEMAGYGFDDHSIYRDSTKFARQLLLADTDLVKFMIEGEEIVTVEERTEYFDAITFEGFGDTYQKLMTMVIHEEDNEELMLEVQHMLGEYLKGLGLDEETQLAVADLFVAPISDFAE